MDARLLDELEQISEEEQAILDGSALERGRYASGRDFQVDCRRLLAQGRLIDIRTHTRFTAFPKHTHNYVEILYMCRGSTTHIINGGARLTLDAGDLLFFSRGCAHEVLRAGREDIGVNFIVLPEFFRTAFDMMEGENILSDFIIDSLTGESGRTPYLHFRAADIPAVQNLVENLVWTLRRGPPARRINEVTMGLLFLHLLAHTGRAESGGDPGRQLALRALTYIDAEYPRASLTEFARRERRPLYQISRAVRRELGAPFQELLREKRFQAAASLLVSTSLPASEIIAMVGYENSSYFYRRFREKYRVSPAEFRKDKQSRGC